MFMAPFGIITSRPTGPRLNFSIVFRRLHFFLRAKRETVFAARRHSGGAKVSSTFASSGSLR